MILIFISVNIDSLDRKSEPRLPWHDTACCVFGDPARDVASHFIQRFNFIKVCINSFISLH